MLAGFGIRQPEIAAHLGISVATLHKHYRADFDRGITEANSKIAGRLFELAMGTGREAVTACIFWLKCRGRWSERAGEAQPLMIDAADAERVAAPAWDRLLKERDGGRPN